MNRSVAVGLLASALCAQQNFDKVVIAIGEDKITAGEYERLIDSLPEQIRTVARGPNKRQLAEQLANMKALAKEARRLKLDQTPEFKNQLAFQMDNLLAGALAQHLQNSVQIAEPDSRKYFDEHINEYTRVRARHILIRVKGSPMPAAAGKPELSDEEALAKANQVRARIQGGEDFASAARIESDDTTNNAQGGDLGFFGRGQMVPAFDQAAFAAKAGEVSEPVKTQFGYHLIRVDQREEKTFDEVRAD
ncbi:MAG: foldase protein PrsA, partial [Bryobacteraceae bacterium]